MRRFIACLAAVIIVGGIAAGAVFALSHSDLRMGSATAGRSAPSCPSVAPTTVGTLTVPPGPIAGYCQDRLVNAAQVINAARALGIGAHTEAIGVMTAMGESGLRNLNHGDAAGADSRGLFQQRANGAWGSLNDRMTPSIAAPYLVLERCGHRCCRSHRHRCFGRVTGAVRRSRFSRQRRARGT